MIQKKKKEAEAKNVNVFVDILFLFSNVLNEDKQRNMIRANQHLSSLLVRRALCLIDGHNLDTIQKKLVGFFLLLDISYRIYIGRRMLHNKVLQRRNKN